MELPEEDTTARHKRSAIQSIMKDTSLTSAQRHLKIQEVMRGHFDIVDDDDDDDESDDDDDDDYNDEDDDESNDICITFPILITILSVMI